MAAYLTTFNAAKVNAQAAQGTPDHINVLLFYQKGCCGSCAEVESYVKDTLNQYYSDDMKSGKISYQVADPKKDKSLADKYNVKDWALKLVITRNGKESVVDVPEIWMYVGNRDASMSTLKNAINKQMGK